jgi:hypothetical protein
MRMVKCVCLVILMGWAFAAKASNSCDTLLTFGSGATLTKVCISNEGNIVKFESPAGFEQIGQLNTFRDGYAMCSGNLPTWPNTSEGYDAGDVSVEAGLGPPTVIQPGGPNTLPLTIIRDSLSGTYRLTQSFAIDGLRRLITITMKVTRLSNADCTSAGCPPLRLTRAFEGDVDNNTSANARFGRSVDSVWEWIDTTGHGLKLSSASNPGVSPITTVYTVTDYDPNGSGAQAAKGCIVFFNQVATPTDPSVTNAANLVGRVMYFLNIPLNGSKTAKVVYHRF